MAPEVAAESDVSNDSIPEVMPESDQPSPDFSQGAPRQLYSYCFKCHRPHNSECGGDSTTDDWLQLSIYLPTWKDEQADPLPDMSNSLIDCLRHLKKLNEYILTQFSTFTRYRDSLMLDMLEAPARLRCSYDQYITEFMPFYERANAETSRCISQLNNRLLEFVEAEICLPAWSASTGQDRPMGALTEAQKCGVLRHALVSQATTVLPNATTLRPAVKRLYEDVKDIAVRYAAFKTNFSTQIVQHLVGSNHPTLLRLCLKVPFDCLLDIDLGRKDIHFVALPDTSKVHPDMLRAYNEFKAQDQSGRPAAAAVTEGNHVLGG
ncbi:uncharacterized protein AB675_7452 [Cyphellophora attinorum]|uniref:Uncharacterized protein n=1 Tax=Cyphellophora attinorum TaxID=1664694 RepID=A0A0N0NMK8_9EURO|nr:uncharacterized protein AB675_7452 [Phialophora attinorum]KPI40468.1 hypothetical protein AB675_7452 [Phialophora attinorum]